MICLAFDQAPRVIGWAYGSDEPGAIPTYGVYGPGDYGHNDQLLFKDVRKFVARKITECGAQAVYFEQIYINTINFNYNVTYAQFAVGCGVMAGCDDCAVQSYEVEIAKWRKRFLGRSNAPKDMRGPKKSGRDTLKEMAELEAARRNLLTTCHDEAEAIGILDYGLAHASKIYRDRTKADVLRRQLAASRKDMER